MSSGHVVRAWSLLAAITGTPLLLAAQTPLRSRTIVSAPSRTNVCLELSSSPTNLVQTPEGLALLRLKRELEGASETLLRNRQLEQDAMRQLAQVQRGVDSAMQVVVRYVGHNGEPDRIVTIRRGDSVRFEARGRLVDPRELFAAMDSNMRAIAPALDSSVRAVAPMMIRSMGPSINAIVRSLQPQVAAFADAAEAQLADDRAQPGGYVGLSLSGAQIRLVTPDGVLTSHCEYPMIESVDAGSPAERAGLVTGDTVVAYNGRDVLQQAVSYPALLVPGHTLRVRVRKSGKAREIPVTVAARVDDGRAASEALATIARVNAINAAARSASGSSAARPAAPRVAPDRPAAAPTLSATATAGGITVLAGAQFATADAEFASTLDLDPGALVLRVAPGTPAAEAGLRAGEVVVRANGVRVRDVGALRRVLAERTGDVRLVVQGKGSVERTVTLRR